MTTTSDVSLDVFDHPRKGDPAPAWLADAVVSADELDVVVAGHDVALPKPHPEPYLVAARALGVPGGRGLAHRRCRCPRWWRSWHGGRPGQGPVTRWGWAVSTVMVMAVVVVVAVPVTGCWGPVLLSW